MIFLGDYVDRGEYCIAVILFLFLLKINFADTVTILRGNHEFEEINRVKLKVVDQNNCFKADCESRYSSFLYKKIVQTFDYLPVAAHTTDYGGIFFVHGGLSPNIQKIEDIQALDRHNITSKQED